MSKRVIITGAASGIGQATVRELRAKGADVVGLDLHASEEEGILACDVRDQAAVDAAIAAAIERLGGGVDVLVNCAGVGIPQSAGGRPDERAQAVIDVNLLGPPARDLATTPRGRLSYAMLARLPRRLVDRAMRRNVRRMARKGAFDGSVLASDFATRRRSG